MKVECPYCGTENEADPDRLDDEIRVTCERCTGIFALVWNVEVEACKGEDERLRQSGILDRLDAENEA